MPWQIRPLEGKYYGTVISGPNDVEIKLWGNLRTWELSEREWAAHGPFETPEDKAEFEREWKCDSHFEDAGDLALARAIVDVLNEAEANGRLPLPQSDGAGQ